MTEEHTDKPKKLTLGASKLSLNKTIDHATLTQSYVKSKTSTVTVEIKKSRSTAGTTQNYDPATKNDTDDEIHKRLSIFKKAAGSFNTQNVTEDKQDRQIGSLSQFRTPSALHEADDEVTEGDAPTALQQPAQPATPLHEVVDHTKHPHHRKKEHTGFDDEEVDTKNKDALNKNVVPKSKTEDQKKINKTHILHMLDEDAEGLRTKTRSLAAIKRSREKEKRKMQAQAQNEKVYREVTLPEVITVGELANRMSERATDVIRELMKLGVISNVNQTIDADTAELIATTLGHTVKRTQESDVENILNAQDDPSQLVKRAPVVTVMGHVDHGKTSLLDALKLTDIVSGEAGGITQHIGAYRVTLPNGEAITFIDTPGHAAFTEMRIRGSKATDIVVLVVAADDGIKAQTIEAINHAKAANVPIIVAINKIDKPAADIERVKAELLQHELVPEDLGGDIVVVPVSALKRTNLDKLEESILLIAEMLALKANPDAPASGVVVESKVDKGKGVMTTVLVQRGTLSIGDIVVAGQTSGRIKRMINDKGHNVHTASPSEPVEIFGLDNAPMAGDQFNIVQTEKQARDICDYRIRKAKDTKISIHKRSSLEDLFLKASGSSAAIKELPIIIKGDVQGSVEALLGSIAKLSHAEVHPKVIHSGAGAITESDIALAQASGSVVLGFNVRANVSAKAAADKNGVDIRYYSIIYNLIDDVKAMISGMLSPIIREQYIGSVEIRQIFNITKVGKVAGSYVTKGIIKAGTTARLLRDDVVIHEGKIKTLRRFKDDVKEAREGYECGIAFENYDDIRVNDTVEVFERIEEKQQML